MVIVFRVPRINAQMHHHTECTGCGTRLFQLREIRSIMNENFCPVGQQFRPHVPQRVDPHPSQLGITDPHRDRQPREIRRFASSGEFIVPTGEREPASFFRQNRDVRGGAEPSRCERPRRIGPSDSCSPRTDKSRDPCEWRMGVDPLEIRFTQSRCAIINHDLRRTETGWRDQKRFERVHDGPAGRGVLCGADPNASVHAPDVRTAESVLPKLADLFLHDRLGSVPDRGPITQRLVDTCAAGPGFQSKRSIRTRNIQTGF